MKGVLDIETKIEMMIEEVENSAEEYFQEIGDDDEGNKCLSQSVILRELLDWIKSDQS